MNSQPNTPAPRSEATQDESQAENQDKISPASFKPPKPCLVCGAIDGHKGGCPGIEAYYEIFLKVKEWEKSISNPSWLHSIVCLECGWTGELQELKEGRCPECAAHNPEHPFRLLTIEEMIEQEHPQFIKANLSKFLCSILKVAGWKVELKRKPYPTETEALRAAWLALPPEAKATTLVAMRNKDPFSSAAADLLAAATP